MNGPRPMPPRRHIGPRLRKREKEISLKSTRPSGKRPELLLQPIRQEMLPLSRLDKRDVLLRQRRRLIRLLLPLLLHRPRPMSRQRPSPTSQTKNLRKFTREPLLIKLTSSLPKPSSTKRLLMLKLLLMPSLLSTKLWVTTGMMESMEKRKKLLQLHPPQLLQLPQESHPNLLAPLPRL